MSPALCFALAFLVLHTAAIELAVDHSMALSYAFLTAAPICALLAALRQCLRVSFLPTSGWSPAAAAFLLWALGMAASATQDLFLGNTYAAPTDSMLLYVLYGVPLTWLVASPWGKREIGIVHAIDGVLATVLGILFFIYTSSMAADASLTPQQQARWLVWLFDSENVFLLLGLSARWFGAASNVERRLFGSLASYAAIYLGTAFFNNHWTTLERNLDIGTLFDVVIPLPFLVFVVMSWRDAELPAPGTPVSKARVRYVRSTAPLLMPAALLAVSLALVRTQYLIGIVGALVAVIGYGLRSALREVRHIETHSKLRDEASIDGLTRIANRRSFDAALTREWRDAARNRQPLGVLMIDADHFKQLNDQHGHAAGDACLRDIAALMRSQLSRPSDLIARYGGEEFVALMPNTDIEGCAAVGESIRAAIERLRIPNNDSPLHVATVSVGAASFLPGPDNDAAALLRAADEAVYQAKHGGRNRVCCAEPKPNKPPN